MAKRKAFFKNLKTAIDVAKTGNAAQTQSTTFAFRSGIKSTNFYGNRAAVSTPHASRCEELWSPCPSIQDDDGDSSSAYKQFSDVLDQMSQNTGLSGFIQNNNHVICNKSNGNSTDIVKASDRKGSSINNDEADVENSLEARYASSIQDNDGNRSTACKKFSKGLDQINLNTGLSGFIHNNNHVVFNKSIGNIKASDRKGTSINNGDAVAENSLEARFASSIGDDDGDSSTTCKSIACSAILSASEPSVIEAINFSNEQPPGHGNSIEQITSAEFIQSTTVEETPRRETSKKTCVRRNLFAKDDDFSTIISPSSSSESNQRQESTIETVPDGVIDLPILEPSEVTNSLSDGGEILILAEGSDDGAITFEESHSSGNSSTVFLDDNQLSNTGPGLPKKRTRKYTPPEKLTRKRQSHPAKWSCNIRKMKMSRGEEYVSSSGKVIPARKVQPPCDKSCRLKCSSKIQDKDRLEIHKGFYEKHPCKEEKWGFISRHVKQFEKKKNVEKETRRKFTRKYFFRIGGEELQVCKTMFLATLDIGEGMVDTVCFKLDEGGNISPDKRGRHPYSQNKMLPGIKQSVRDHIACVPRMPSHYSRAQSTKEYLMDEIHSVKDLHALYVEWMEKERPEEKIATYRQYNDIFNNEYNIQFFISKKDLCDECFSYENSTEEERQQMQEAYDQHLRNKNLAEAMLDADRKVSKDKNSKELSVICFDYEKSLPCPKAKASGFYYRRKLTVSNLTFVDVGRCNDNCYVYDETIAGKGSNEVASCLLHFMTRKVEEGVKEFRTYSVNCTGQNKNRAVASVLLHAAEKFGVTIRHRFLEKGHTYNACDTVHSLIERKAKPLDIYTPQQWYDVMASAKRSKTNPIEVIQVNQSMIRDWKSLAEMLNLEKDVDGNSFSWLELRELSFDGKNSHEMKVKINLDDPTYRVVSTKKVGRPVNLKEFVPNLVYDGPLSISAKKLKDLIHYCDTNIIPAEHQEYIRRLKPSDKDDDDAGDEQQPVGRARKRRARAPRQSKAKKPKNSTVAEDDENLDEDDIPLADRQVKRTKRTRKPKKRASPENRNNNTPSAPPSKKRKQTPRAKQTPSSSTED